MSDSIRCFFAIRIPQLATLRQVSRELAVLGRSIRLADVDQLHLTVKFLGEAAVGDVTPLVERVTCVLRDVPPFGVEIVGLGAFPTMRRPSVLWAGLAPGDPVCRVARSIEAVCDACGYPPERRPFRPHVTLARIAGRPPGEVLELLERYESVRFGAIDVDSVELMQSVPRRTGGPEYVTLARIAIGA